MFNFFAIPTNQLVIPIKGKKGGVALCLFLIVVGLTILTYRPMQVSGFAVKPALDIVSHFNGKGHGVAPDSVRLYIGIVNPQKCAILTLGRLLHSIVLVSAQFGEKPIPILKFQREILSRLNLCSDCLWILRATIRE